MKLLKIPSGLPVLNGVIAKKEILGKTPTMRHTNHKNKAFRNLKCLTSLRGDFAGVPCRNDANVCLTVKSIEFDPPHKGCLSKDNFKHVKGL
jgi:hypothetical protein